MPAVFDLELSVPAGTQGVSGAAARGGLRAAGRQRGVPYGAAQAVLGGPAVRGRRGAGAVAAGLAARRRAPAIGCLLDVIPFNPPLHKSRESHQSHGGGVCLCCSPRWTA